LAAARAVIFAQMVDDPSAHPDLFPTEKKQEKERQRLFKIIEDLVQWENTTNEEVLERARAEIWQSWRRTCAENADHPRAKELFDRHKLPAFHDPFAGGGALPLEAQRLGLDSYASDLNPVAVLINKAMIEIPPRFEGRPPVNPPSRNDSTLLAERWRGAQGLADDIRYYGNWMREQAEKRLGHLYPSVEITASMVAERPDLHRYLGRRLTTVAWLWTRTVKSPNPAFAHVDVPLVSTFMLSTKRGKPAYVEPIIEHGTYRFVVKVGAPIDAESAKAGTKLSRGANFRCLMSSTPIAGDYIKAEGAAGRMGAKLMAIVAEGDRERVYLSPTPEHEQAAQVSAPEDVPQQDLPAEDTGNFWCTIYGLRRFADLFTPRQLAALTTFSDLLAEAGALIRLDAARGEVADDGVPLRLGGAGATAYSEAVVTYLAFAISKLADRGSTICTWFTERDSTRNTFARQSIPMTWDYAELNVLLAGTGSFMGAVEWTAESIDGVAAGLGSAFGSAEQANATTQDISDGKVVSTDPPYYDNIGYADLSDFFYVWLRRSLRPLFPELFGTLVVPKAQELVATPYRHGGRDAAERFFLDGMTQTMHRLAERAHSAFPVTIYYAFKQSETETAEGTTSTGWETFLDAVILAGFAISGTWPMRTELGNRMIGSGTNALASSIVLVCRKRESEAPTTSRGAFVAALKTELPEALRHLQASNIAPVDLAQAAIGPGMAVYTQFAAVLDAEGKNLTVRQALGLINQVLDEVLAEQEGDFDVDSRWALAWFDQYAFNDGPYGEAEVLATAKANSVAGLVESGILISRAGKVRLLAPGELPDAWDPAEDRRINVWEMLHHLIRVFEHAGEAIAAQLLAKYGSKADIVRELAYRLYTACERRKRAKEAGSYNALVQSWPEVARLAKEGPAPVAPQQGAGLFDQE
jgi:putative DNA methylase